jgi:hypothetical protein
MISWFRTVADPVWGRIQAEKVREIPDGIFLITAQITARECWVANGPSCSAQTDTLLAQLPQSATSSIWIGKGILPFTAGDGFRQFGGGIEHVSIFIDATEMPAPSFWERNVLVKREGNPTAVHRSGTTAGTKTLGLDVFYPKSDGRFGDAPDINVVFVHGLGGSAHGTWVHPKTKWFWPNSLPLEPGLENIRLMTFGYNSDWQTFIGPSSCLGFQEFAVQLLDKLSLLFQEHGMVIALL